jgi:homoserine kinase
LVDALRASGVPAAVSGAGPTVLAFPVGGELPARLGPGGDVTAGFTRYRLDVARTGAIIEQE